MDRNTKQEDQEDQEELKEDLERGENPYGELDSDLTAEALDAVSEAAGGAVAEESDPVLLRQILAEQLSKAEENYDRLLRLQADYDNFRRRTRQEKEEFYKYASEKLINTLLPVLDNFELALSAEGDSIENIKSGVQMIYKQLLDVLATEGVAPIPAVGEQFDPLKHEAVLRAESDEHPDNTIVQELRRGYFLKDKVIRPSMVKVVKS
jgi:molecular chaperone GrpE